MSNVPNSQFLSPGGSSQWWTASKHTQILGDLHRWRQEGLTWKCISKKLNNVLHPATLSLLYKRNFGKLTPKDFVSMLPPDPPDVEPPSRIEQEDLDTMWAYLGQGVSPSLLIQMLIRKKRFYSERAARNFMKRWLRSVAEEVWGMPASEMLERRKKESRKSAKCLKRLDNLKPHKAVPKTDETPATEEKHESGDILEFETETGKFIWNTSKDPPIELILEASRIGSMFVEKRTEREFALYDSWIKAIVKYAVDLDKLEI